MHSVNSKSEIDLRPICRVTPVAICGPIAEEGCPAAGGREAYSLRVMQLQESMGLNPIALRYPSVKDRLLPIKVWSYLRDFRKIERHIRVLSRDTILHFMPLCRQFIRFEEKLIKLARASGHPVVLDFRAGNTHSEYSARGPSYRSVFERILSMADVVVVEGSEYIQFVRSILPDTCIFHIPNFIMSEEVVTHAEDRPTDVVTLTYVGSVIEEKGLLQCVQLTNELSARGLNVTFNVIGSFSLDFATRLREIAVGPGKVNLLGAQPFAVVRQTLARSHFFLLLTEWRGEGHSAALTEAMGQGAIPIVTDHGFCRSVVGEDGIVVVDRNQIGQIASSVMNLIGQTGEVSRRSQRLTDRVRSLYTSDAVRTSLTEVYCSAIAARER